MSKYWLVGAVSVLLLGWGCTSQKASVNNTKPLDAPPGIPGEEINNPVTLPSPAPAPAPAPEPENKVEVKANAEVSITPPEVKVFNVEGSSFAFSPGEIRVKKGDTVKIVFKNIDGFHDLTIGGYNVGTSRVGTGGTGMVEFVADKTGTFEYYCSVGSHRDLGMMGKLTVE